jgi:hypothetical protein
MAAIGSSAENEGICTMNLTTRHTGQGAEHWVAYQLVKQGWDVTFLGGNIPSYDMIAYKNGVGARTIQVKGTVGLKNDYPLGNPDEWSADWLIFVVDPIHEPRAYLYRGNLVRDCPVGAVEGVLINRDRNPGKQGYRAAWMIARRFKKDPQVLPNGWHLLDDEP